MKSIEEQIREIEEGLFICKGCGQTLSKYLQIKTFGYCYLCDPNITVKELLEDYDKKHLPEPPKQKP